MPQLYLDLDGVLADFDTGYERLTGRRPAQEQDDVDWNAIREHYGFYRDLPIMPDAHVLWTYCIKFSPIVLTGVPHSIPDVEVQKRKWCRQYLGDIVKIICCASREKYLYCSTGDVLVDDRENYKHLWVGAGGKWITHTSALETVKALDGLGFY